jgi:polyhydroxyalkanoate synthesis regulator phasin
MPRARSAPASRSSGSTRKASAGSGSSSSRAKSSSTRAKASTSRAKASTTRAKSSSSGGSATKRTAAAKKGGQARGRQQTATKRARQATAPLDFSGKSVAELRNALKGGVITPLNLVMLTRDRIEEALEDAVSRGRMTSADAQKLATELVSRGRKQTNEVLRDLDKLLGSGGDVRKRSAEAASRARKQVGAATARARTAADPVIARADRVRRTAGVGPAFPISGYDDLSVSQIQKRLGGLKPAELRKVRDYERRHANRKGVLSSIEQKL